MVSPTDLSLFEKEVNELPPKENLAAKGDVGEKRRTSSVGAIIVVQSLPIDAEDVADLFDRQQLMWCKELRFSISSEGEFLRHSTPSKLDSKVR
jgi:hypothetical protein